MKVMKNKWCWIGLVLCTSSLAWAAKDKKEEKSDSDTKESAAADSATSDEGSKDETADEEDEAAPKSTKKTEKAEVKAELAPPSQGKKIEIAALAGIGASTAMRLGIGLRLGMNWGPTDGLYVGLIGTYFGGTSVTQERFTGTAERTRSTIITAAEVGYNVEVGTDFLVRPYLAPGIAIVTDKTCATGTCTNDNGARLTISPGLQAAYLLAPPVFYVGADLRYQIIMNTSDATAGVISLTVGLRI